VPWRRVFNLCLCRLHPEWYVPGGVEGGRF
jgi:hypothetical protein